MFFWNELCSNCKYHIACWYFPVRDTRSRRIPGTDISRYAKSCSGWKNTADRNNEANGASHTPVVYDMIMSWRFVLLLTFRSHSTTGCETGQRSAAPPSVR